MWFLRCRGDRSCSHKRAWTICLLSYWICRVFQSKDEFLYLREKWDTGKVRAWTVGKKNGDSVVSVSLIMISSENND